MDWNDDALVFVLVTCFAIFCVVVACAIGG